MQGSFVFEHLGFFYKILCTTVLDRMIEKLQGVTILEDDATKLCKSLNLHDDTITDLAPLCQQWKQAVNSNCSPVSLVEVLMYTKGIGRHVSGLFCKLL